MNNKNDRLVWVDIETTGLDPKKDLILEVAFIITGPDLEPVDFWERVVYHDARRLDLHLSPTTFEMHEKNGLLKEVAKSSFEARDVMYESLERMQAAGVPIGKGILAGSSVHFDRAFLAEQMSLLEAFFYHRMFDTSALKTAAQMWAPHLLPAKTSSHRALEDIQASLALARHFKKQLFERPLGALLDAAKEGQALADGGDDV